MPYKDLKSPEAIASRRACSARSAEKRRKLRESYLEAHPELRKHKPTPDSNEARRLRELAKNSIAQKKPEGRDRNNSARYKYRYGISLEQRNAKIALQHGLCTLCGKPLDELGLGGPAVDHQFCMSGSPHF